MGTVPARRRRSWSLRWKVFAAFVLISLVGPLAAAVITQRLVLHTLEVQTHTRLLRTARGIAAELGRDGALAPGAPGGSHLHAVASVAATAAQATVAIAGATGQLLVGVPTTAAGTALTPALAQVLRRGEVACPMPSVLCSQDPAFASPTVLAGAPVRSGNTTVGAVVLASPVRVVRAAALFQQRVIFESWAVGIVLALLLGLVLAGGITQPLRAIAQAAEGVSRGDFRHRVPPGAGDEIGQLADAFNRMAERLERVLAARRELLASVSHELRTPLTSIQGFVQALREGLIAPEATERTYAIVEEEIDRLRRLIEELFELAKLEAGQVKLRLARCSAAELLESAAERGRAVLGAGGPRIETEVAGDVGVLLADPDRIFQVLGNLVQNALRFTPPGGRVVLRVLAVPSGSDGSEWVRFEVEDTGTGIAPEELDQVFERFYTAERSRSRPEGGTGLGLSIAREIVRAHGGRIGAESEPGQGSLFWCELPRRGPTGS